MNRANYITKAAVIATVYVLVTYLFKPIGYGPSQIRVSEALTLLPLMESSAVPGLFIGCLLANILGGLGLWDVCLGSLITLVAAYITGKMSNPILGSLPPVILNAFRCYLSHKDLWSALLANGCFYWLGSIYSSSRVGYSFIFCYKKDKFEIILKKINRRGVIY